MDFIQLDAGSSWAEGTLVAHYIRAGNLSQAREQATKLQNRPVENRPVEKMVGACLNHAPAVEQEKDARELAPVISDLHDPEARYVNAAYFAFCSQKDTAVRLMKSAIAGIIAPTPTCRTMPCSPAFEALQDLPNYSPLPNSAGTIFSRKEIKAHTESLPLRPSHKLSQFSRREILTARNNLREFRIKIPTCKDKDLKINREGTPTWIARTARQPTRF